MAMGQYHHVLQCLTFADDRGRVRQAKNSKIKILILRTLRNHHEKYQELGKYQMSVKKHGSCQEIEHIFTTKPNTKKPFLKNSRWKYQGTTLKC